MADSLIENLNDSRKLAAEWVYEADRPTPTDRLTTEFGELVLKREDLSYIRSYKWRGAYFKLKKCVQAGQRGPFVATSAGNHAQGVALAASRLGVDVHIFMPRSTPRLKQRAVERIGASHVNIRLIGDNYEQASEAAAEFAQSDNLSVIPPFDDVDVIAGQSTIGDELLKEVDELGVVFVPIGGGGLASGVAFSLKQQRPSIQVIGVEVVGQDAMCRSIQEQKIQCLESVDIFCDGTAVMKPGAVTFDLCREFLDEVITVTNEQVCAAIQLLWEEKRLITEPSGAIGLAGCLAWCQQRSSAQMPAETHGVNCVIVSGGNTDFLTLPSIVRRSQMAQPTRCYFRFEIDEQKGSLISLLDLLFDDVNIVDFQYGKTSRSRAFPVLGLYATPEQQQEMLERIKASGIPAEDVSGRQSSRFRVIPFRPDLTENPRFLQVDFPDRPGALRDLMREVSDLTNICYFNFNETGEVEGHALIGFEFHTDQDAEACERVLKSLGFHYHHADLSGVLF